MNHPLLACLHLPPAPGCVGHVPLWIALDAFVSDVSAALEGGVDGLLLENENDKPHSVLVSKAQVAWLTRLAVEARRRTKLPVGIGVQRMDWEAALSIALAAELELVRLDVFVDRVRMGADVVEVDPRRVRDFRAELGAERIALWTDVHVKHAELISGASLAESVDAAVGQGAAAVLVTSDRTGVPPRLEDLQTARRAAAGRAPVVIGSGLTAENAGELRFWAEAAVVGTSLKVGPRVSRERVREVVAAWRG